MKLYGFKIFLMRFLHTPPGKILLRALSSFVSVRNLSKSGYYSGGSRDGHPFIVAITIDTESGYVDKNEKRIWQYENPEAYCGFYFGIKNWRDALKRHKAPATFFLSTNCFSAKGSDYKKIRSQLKALIKDGNELGLHLHPDSDLALQKEMKRTFESTSAKFYSEKELSEMIRDSLRIIKAKIGISPTSLRWGNWALSNGAVKGLQANRIKIDSSATPGISGHKGGSMEYDWSRVDSHYPWALSRNDYQNTKEKNTKILEIPIATYSFFGFTLRADPVYSVLLEACFDFYYRNADRSKRPFIFVIITHSSEGTKKDGSTTLAIEALDQFITHAKSHKDIEFRTLNKCTKYSNKPNIIFSRQRPKNKLST